MKISNILSFPAIAVLCIWNVAADNGGFETTVDDLAQVTVISNGAQLTTLGLTAATFAIEAPIIVNGLYNISEVGAKYIRQTHGARALDDELAGSALYDLAILVDAQRTLMNELIQKRALVSEFSFDSQLAEAIHALLGATQGAEDALARIIPTRTEESQALFSDMNSAIQNALEAYT